MCNGILRAWTTVAQMSHSARVMECQDRPCLSVADSSYPVTCNISLMPFPGLVTVHNPPSLSPSATKSRIVWWRHIHHQTRKPGVPFISSSGWLGLFLPNRTKSPASTPSTLIFLCTAPTTFENRRPLIVPASSARDLPCHAFYHRKGPASFHILTKTRTEHPQWSPSLNIADVEPTFTSPSARRT